MPKRQPIEPGVPFFIIKIVRSVSVFQVLLPVCRAHSDILISKEPVVKSTFKLTGRDSGICFTLRFFFVFLIWTYQLPPKTIS